MSGPLLFGIIMGLHDLATVIWIGGLFTLGLVVLPSVRTAMGLGPETKKLMSLIHRRLRKFAFSSMAVLLITGLLLAKHSPQFTGLFSFDSGYSVLLSVKHILVVLMIGIALLRNRMLSAGVKQQQAPDKKLSGSLLYLNICLGTAVVILSGLSSSWGQIS